MSPEGDKNPVWTCLHHYYVPLSCKPSSPHVPKLQRRTCEFTAPPVHFLGLVLHAEDPMWPSQAVSPLQQNLYLGWRGTDRELADPLENTFKEQDPVIVSGSSGKTSETNDSGSWSMSRPWSHPSRHSVDHGAPPLPSTVLRFSPYNQ